ncbi:hypothetical protein [Streptomyces sp. NPDC005533]|uniref:hypothetical protein n=1 Tax=Streptomyces sp. NPDC005533 TaxID=3364723 RepID=UPI0036830268
MLRKLFGLAMSLAVAPLFIFAPPSAAATVPVTDNIRAVFTAPGATPAEVTLKFKKNGTGEFAIQWTDSSGKNLEYKAGPESNACFVAYCAYHNVMAYGAEYAVSFFLTPVASDIVTTENQYSLRAAANIGDFGGGRGYCLTSKYALTLRHCGDNSFSKASQAFKITAVDPSKQARINQYMLQAGLNVCETTKMATCTYSNVRTGSSKWGTAVQAADSWIKNTGPGDLSKTVAWWRDIAVETRAIKGTTSGWSINAEIGGSLAPKESWASASATVTAGISSTVHNETQTAVIATQKYMSTTSLTVPTGDTSWIAIRPLVVPVTTAIEINYYPTNYEGGRQTDNLYGYGAHATYRVDSFTMDIPVKADNLSGTYRREIACFKSTMEFYSNCASTYTPVPMP